VRSWSTHDPAVRDPSAFALFPVYQLNVNAYNESMPAWRDTAWTIPRATIRRRVQTGNKSAHETYLFSRGTNPRPNTLFPAHSPSARLTMSTPFGASLHVEIR
jgi:hypothetical protein